MVPLGSAPKTVACANFPQIISSIISIIPGHIATCFMGVYSKQKLLLRLLHQTIMKHLLYLQSSILIIAVFSTDQLFSRVNESQWPTECWLNSYRLWQYFLSSLFFFLFQNWWSQTTQTSSTPWTPQPTLTSCCGCEARRVGRSSWGAGVAPRSLALSTARACR